MKNIIEKLLLIFLFLSLILGELTRIQFVNGVAFSLQDIICTFVLFYIIILAFKNKNYFKSKLSVPLMLFSSVLILSLAVNIARLTLFQAFVSSLYILRWISLASVYFFVRNLPEKVNKRIPFYANLAGFLFVILGFAQYFLYPDLRNLYYAGWDQHYLRLFSSYFDPNFAGVFLVLIFLLALKIFLQSFTAKNKFIKIFVGIVALLACLSIFLTYSRSAFIALAVGLLSYIFLKGNKKVLAISLLVVILFFLFTEFLTGVPTEGAHLLRIPSSEARVASLKNALTIFSENPILGVGYDAYRYAQIKHKYLTEQNWETTHTGAGTDNSFLFVLATTGIIGFVFYLFLFYKIIVLSLKLSSEYSVVVFSSVIALISSSFFLNSLFFPPMLLWIWILIGVIENK